MKIAYHSYICWAISQNSVLDYNVEFTIYSILARQDFFFFFFLIWKGNTSLKKILSVFSSERKNQSQQWDAIARGILKYVLDKEKNIQLNTMKFNKSSELITFLSVWNER